MPGEFDAAINQALDAYESMQRKAEAWDRLMEELQHEIVDGTPITPTLFHVIKSAAERIDRL